LRADGSRLPALINSTLVTEDNGRPRFVRTTVFEASDRRRYEEELLRARREEHEIAVQLQRGLLARELPIFEDIEVAAAYRPGRSGTEVGGDWYDAFSTDEAGNRVCFVVGDVVGHGIEAAAEMGQLRSAIRAFASTGMGPGALMEALDGYSNRHGVGRMATVACAELDVSSRLLRYVCAGHLPPVLAEPGERPRILWDGRSTPLAITPGAERAEGEAGLPAGASLFLYSDGLVERRSRGIDAGLEQLLEEIEPLASEPPAELAQGLIRTLHDPDAVDDVCLLVARPRR
jgi:serine/threonine-protein kinase RsbW